MRKPARRSATSNTYRFFVAPTLIQGEQVDIDDPELAHQMAHVLRLQAADRVTLLDNTGWEYTVALTSLSRQRVLGHVEEQRQARGEPQLELRLYVALLKGERFEWILQKGTELGVSSFVPLVCERGVVDEAGIRGTKLERWERIIREAAEQSRRGRLPELHSPQQFKAACGEIAQAQALLLWEGQGAPGLRDTLASGANATLPRRPIALFSGPEGGWSDDEIATALMYNITQISLGPRTLRAETAPLAAAAAIFYEFGDLGSG